MQGDDKLLHRVREAEHRGDQAQCRHNTAARYTRSRNHGNAQHEYKRSKHGKGRGYAACKHDAHRAEYEADGIAVEVDGSAQRNDKVGNVVIYIVIICTVQRNRNSRCRGLGAECGKVRRSGVLHAFEVVLAADNACQTKLRHDVQQLQHNNNGIQGSEHLDGSRQTALGCDVGEQTCDVDRDQRNDNAAEYAGNDFLQIAENIQQGITLKVCHADADHEREHKCGHNAEHRVNRDGEQRLEGVADEEGQQAGNNGCAVGQQQGQTEQTVGLLAKLCHADRDERQDNQRDHE